jgi:hypothetical protein
MSERIGSFRCEQNGIGSAAEEALASVEAKRAELGSAEGHGTSVTVLNPFLNDL